MIPRNDRRKPKDPAAGLYREDSAAFKAYRAEAGRWQRFAAGAEPAAKPADKGSGGSFFAAFRRSFAGSS